MKKDKVTTEEKIEMLTDIVENLQSVSLDQQKLISSLIREIELHKRRIEILWGKGDQSYRVPGPGRC